MVVSIIAGLLAMLAPALNSARESAKKSACASNLHQIGLSCQAYANDHENLLPPFYVGLHYRWPNQSYVAYNKKPVGPGPWNLAYLFENKYISEPSIFYCPSQGQADHVFRSYPYPWGSAAPNGKLYVLVSYSYNPYCEPIYGQNLYQKFSAMPSQKILALDIPVEWSTAHMRQKDWNWNIVFPDQHVEYRSNSAASELIRADPTLTADWEVFNTLTALLEK